MSRAEYIRKLTTVAILLLILIALGIRTSLTNKNEDIPPVLTGTPEPPPVNILSCAIMEIT